MLKNFFQDDEGATAIEYALIATIISAVIITSAIFLGTNLSVSFDYVATSVATTTP